MAAVRQYEMNENITLLTTTTCAARPRLRADREEPLESSDDGMKITWDRRSLNYLGRCRLIDRCADALHRGGSYSCRPSKGQNRAWMAQHTVRRKVPFQSGSGHTAELPARLADGLGLESALIRRAQHRGSAPAAVVFRWRNSWVPRSRTKDARD